MSTAAATTTAYDELVSLSREAALLGGTAGLLGWDQEVHMPRGGIAYRGRQLAQLARMRHELVTSERMAELLAACDDDASLTADPESPVAVNIRELKRDHERAVRLPASLVEEEATLASEGQHTWAEARSADDFSRFRPVLEREAASRGLDPNHLWALMYTESRFRRHVVSVVGARGALQIMPWTGRQLAERLGEYDGSFDFDTLFDINTNARLATYYVSELMAKFHGQPAMAYASYNGGPFNVSRWLAAKSSGGGGTTLELDEFIEEIPFRETGRYTRRVLEVKAAYDLLYKGELPRWTNSVDPKFEDNINF